MRRLALCVAAAAVVTGACGGSGGSGTTATSSGSGPGVAGGAPTSASVSAKGLAFTPSTVRIAKGGTVTWKFEDNPTPHNVTAADGSFKTDNLTSGTYSHTFTTAGSFKYSCTIHPSMKGTVVVVAS
jgi:plastocyanin